MQTTAAQSPFRIDSPVRLVVCATLLAWLIVITFLSATEHLKVSGPFSPPAAALETMLALLVVFAAWPSLRRAIVSIGVRRLTAIHMLRVAATPLFLWYGAHDLIPQNFAHRAGWGDAIAALAALVAVTVWRTRAGYVAAQLIGLADFVEAFATAIPTARQNPEAMHAVTVLPLSLIPYYLVGLLAATHIINLYLLRTGDRKRGY